MSLHLLQLRFRPDNLFRRGEDEGYSIHRRLSELFGTEHPKPFRLTQCNRHFAEVLAYSDKSSEAWRDSFWLTATPIAEKSLLSFESKEIPTIPQGTRLGFEVLVCPIRQSNGSQRDALFCAGEGVDREQAYCDWLREKVPSILSCSLKSYELKTTTRQTSDRRMQRFTMPSALMEGVLEAHTLPELLSHGIGRHRSFGYGMVLLRPASRV